MNQPRWTGRVGDRVLGESTAVRNPTPSTAVMPDARCASHFVRSVAEPRACVCRYLFPSSPALATGPGFKATHACAFASSRDRQHWQADGLKINRGLWKDRRKGRVRDRKEGGFRYESGRELCVPVTWLECRALRSCDKIRNRHRHRGFPACHHTAAYRFTRHTVLT